MIAVSSIHSNVSRALRVSMPTKLKKTLVPAPPQLPTETVIDFATPVVLPQTSIVIAEPPTRPRRKAATKATEALQPSHKGKRSSPSVTESDESLASTQTCPPTASSTSAPSRQKRRQMIKQQQMQNKSIVSTIQKTAASNQNVKSDFTVGPCSPVQSFPAEYYVSPNYKGPEKSMTVGEAERIYESDSDLTLHKHYSIIVLFKVTSAYFISFLINYFSVFLLRGKCDIVYIGTLILQC